MGAVTHNPKGKQGAAADEPLDKAKEAGAQAVAKAKESVASVGEMAGHAVSAVGKTADDLAGTAGSDIKHWGENVRDNGPQDGLVGQASHVLAETLQGGGHYLEEAKLSGLADDVVKLIKQNPMPAVLIGFGMGLLLGRAMRS